MKLTLKPRKFHRKQAAQDAVAECQSQGWAAGIIGRGPWMVQATGRTQTHVITYDLHEDGFMREYSRKEIEK